MPKTIPSCPFEHVPEQETNEIQELSNLTVQLLDKRYNAAEKALRGVHPKSHGCVNAKFSVNEDIDEAFRVGLFATPGSDFEARIRFSNAAARVLPDVTDEKHGSRGMAIKVMNVEGQVLEKDKGQNNQDFLMINQPVFAFSNTEDYLKLNQILLSDEDKPDRFFATVGEISNQLTADLSSVTDAEKRLLRSFEIVQGIQKTPLEQDTNPLEMQYFSAAPFLFGEGRVMKFSVKPNNVDKSSASVDYSNDNYLRDALTSTITTDAPPIKFSFMVQVRNSTDDIQLEDASALWDENQFQFTTLATITISRPQNNLLSKQWVAECEELEFNPWHSLTAHQPLGSINRSRLSVYTVSAEHRR